MIYTRKGDSGQTDLADGTRVSKTDVRIQCVGILDELCSYLGLVLSLVPQEMRIQLSHETELIVQAQRYMFSLGSWAAALKHPQKMPEMEQVYQLERAIDRMSSEMAETAFTGFVLPGGHPVAAHTHVARTLCRKAERILLEAGAENWLESHAALPYLNRLSDFLYVLAKKINRLSNFRENKW